MQARPSCLVATGQPLPHNAFVERQMYPSLSEPSPHSFGRQTEGGTA